MAIESIQDVITISLLKTANELAKQSAETLYASIGAPAPLKTDTYTPTSVSRPVTYTRQATHT